jgi:multidrug efflux system membrane fusion protein
VAEAKARTGNINVILDGLGIVTPVYTVNLNSRVTGQVTEVDYQEGQRVKKGDKLVVVDPRPYAAVLAQAKGALAQGQANLDNARVDLKRYQEAFKTHAIPQQQLATQEATVKGDEGTVQLDQANVDAAQLNLDFCTITSPIDGRVGLRALDPGNLVTANASTTLVTITQLQPITVIFTVPEDSLGEILPEIKPDAPLRVDALDRAETKTLATGQLETLDNQVNTATGTVRARATFANAKNELFPNQFVNAKLYVKTLHQVVLVPNAAVQHNEQAAFVYVVGPDSRVKSTAVTVTVTEGDTAAVTGIKAGDTVVTDGFEKLQDGILISAKEPNANKDKAQTMGADGNPPAQAPKIAAPKPSPGA